MGLFTGVEVIRVVGPGCNILALASVCAIKEWGMLVSVSTAWNARLWM